jgi:hypothetical protein
MAINLRQKVGPLPLWGWGVVAIVAYYVWTRYYGSGASSTVDAGYDTYTGAGDSGGFGGVGGGAGGGSGGGSGGGGESVAPDEQLPAEEPMPEPGAASDPNRNRRHRIQRVKRKSARRIAAIREGGVTTAERNRIQQIKQRRQTRIRRIRHGRR